MKGRKRINAIEQHIARHPNDYQSIISLFKIRTEEVEWQLEKRRHERRRKVAECRRMLDEQERKTR